MIANNERMFRQKCPFHASMYMEAKMADPNVEMAINFGATDLLKKAENAEAILERLYDEYSHALFRYALALTSSCEDAEDAVQEVFVRIAREAKKLARLGNIRAYLFAATRNAAYSILRSRKRRNKVEDSTCAEIEVGLTVSEGEDHIRLSILRQVFLSLPVEQREVVLLKVFDGMTFQEIAKTIGISANTAASRYRYGIERLKRALEEGEDGR